MGSVSLTQGPVYQGRIRLQGKLLSGECVIKSTVGANAAGMDACISMLPFGNVKPISKLPTKFKQAPTVITLVKPGLNRQRAENIGTVFLNGVLSRLGPSTMRGQDVNVIISWEEPTPDDQPVGV